MKTIFVMLIVAASFSLADAQVTHPAMVSTNAAVFNRSLNKAAVPLQLSHPTEDFHALVRKGDKWVATTNAWRHSGATTNLVVELNKPYLVMQKAPMQSAVSDHAENGRILSSCLVLMTRKVGGPASTNTETISGNFYVKSASGSLLWDSKEKVYQADLIVEYDLPKTADDLKQILPMAVLFMGSNVRLSPTNLVTITQPGVPGLQKVIVSSGNYTTNAAIIAHYGGTDGRAYDAPCSLTIERLSVLGMINLMFPTPFLFAILVGGCVGGILRLFKLRRKERAEWYWLVPEGMLVGLVFVAALAAGIGSATGSLSPTVVGSEVGAFAIAALSGFLGTSALDYFTKNLEAA